ncbi:MAG: branched-chain amino acid ABC transporter permease, partial [Gaiellaceae bacterium]
MTRTRDAVALLGPLALLALVGVVGSFMTSSRALEFIDALVFVAIVVALYVFVGNSGVLSFGQIGFFILGAYAAGELTVPADAKQSVLPEVFSVIRDHSVGNAGSLVVAAAVGAIYAFLLGIPLMRLSGLAAGIATFAVLEVTQNIVRNWEKIG